MQPSTRPPIPVQPLVAYRPIALQAQPQRRVVEVCIPISGHAVLAATPRPPVIAMTPIRQRPCIPVQGNNLPGRVHSFAAPRENHPRSSSFVVAGNLPPRGQSFMVAPSTSSRGAALIANPQYLIQSVSFGDGGVSRHSGHGTPQMPQMVSFAPGCDISRLDAMRRAVADSRG